jgi:hypothetical protein
MRLLVAILLGFLSGFLVYMIAAMLIVGPGTPGASSMAPLVLITFVGGWVVSSYFLYRGAKTASKVFSRGALLGAAEWIAFAAAGVLFSGRAAFHSAGASGGSDAAQAGAAIGGGIAAALTGGIALFMAVACLVVFAIAHFTGREMADTTGHPTKKCPECAEMIQAEARKCRHCGAAVAPA